MKKEQLVFNFLIFAEKIEKGASQAELFPEIAALGFQKIEVRREYFKDLEKEMPAVKQAAKANGIELFYSVPDEVYVDGKINPQLIGYLVEAEQMGIEHIKWNIGDFNGELNQEALEELLAHGIAINIENDQTQTSGTILAISTFMKAVQKADLNIGYVYDLGNWRFVGEDELEAAAELKGYVRYIHMKDVAYVNEKPQAAGLDHGVLAWRKVLDTLPKDVPVAIEYPTTETNQITEAMQLLEEV